MLKYKEIIEMFNLNEVKRDVTTAQAIDSLATAVLVLAQAVGEAAGDIAEAIKEAGNA